MKIGFGSIAFGKIENLSTLLSVLRTVKETGYSGIGFEYPLLPDEAKRNPSSVAEALVEVGLTPVGVAPQLYKTTLEFASQIGCDLLWVVFQNSLLEAVETTKNHLPIAKDLSVRLAIHPHLHSPIETEEELQSFLLRCPSELVGVCFDTAHLRGAGVNLERFIERFADRILLVHLKDLLADKPKELIDVRRDFVNVGEGVIDFRPVLKTLRAAGYQGWYLLEVDFPQGETGEETAKKNFERASMLLSEV